MKNWKDKTIIITGAELGIGRSVAEILSETQASIIIAGLNEKEGEKTENYIRNKTKNENIKFLKCDLSSFESIKTFHEEMIKKFGENFKLDILINNAAIADPKFKEIEILNRKNFISASSLEENNDENEKVENREEEEEGKEKILNSNNKEKDDNNNTTNDIILIEKNFAINYLGHFYLTKLMIPHLLQKKTLSPKKENKENSKNREIQENEEEKEEEEFLFKIINVSSGCHNRFADPIKDIKIPPQKNNGQGMKLQSNTKLLNIIHAKVLVKKISEILSNDKNFQRDQNFEICSVNPGIAKTDIVKESFWGKLLMNIYSPFSQSVKNASNKIIKCCFEKVENGAYYAENKKGNEREDCNDEVEGERIWNETEKLVNRIEEFLFRK